MKRAGRYQILLWLWIFFFSGNGQAQQILNPQDLSTYLADLENRFPGLSKEGKHLNYEIVRLQTGARQVHPSFPILYSTPLNFPQYGYNLSSHFLNSRGNPEALTYLAFRSLAAPAGGWGPPLSGSLLPASMSIDQLLWENDDQCLRWEYLPAGFREQILSFLGLIMEAKDLVDEFSKPVRRALGPELKSGWRERMQMPWNSRFLKYSDLTVLPGMVDLRDISLASRLLASGLRPWQTFSVDFQFPGKGPLIIESPVGRIGIFGPGADTISGDFALIVDLGGNDLYQDFKAGADAGQSVSVLLDLSGNDHYESPEDALLQACLGMAILMDREGDDVYLSGQAGLASATYGFALLYDLDGDDSYCALEECSLGSAHVGVGILADLRGDDHYQSESRSLGFGGCRGLGILMDLQGNDQYNSPQNSPSFVLGSSLGRWAEFSDGFSLGGGMGLFVDARGQDHYYSGSFSQGASYYMGQGVFCDLHGQDSYNARSHSQGFAAHYSLAAFLDYEGNDSYNEFSDTARMTQLLGGGRDLSFGCFIDCLGDDVYHFGNRSVGIGDINGLGLFWDCSGENRFIWHRNEVNRGSESMGNSPGSGRGQGSAPHFFRTPEGSNLGVFCDDELFPDNQPDK